jgi:Amt family ammonium transporter
MALRTFLHAGNAPSFGNGTTPAPTPYGTIPPKDQNCPDSDEAWMLMATVLVLGMFPGVAFFEAGLLRLKNTVTILAQVFCGLAMLSVMWICFGFSLTFSRTATNGFIGNLDNAFLINVGFDDCLETQSRISTALYAMFQLMFACITPLLMTGAYAERLAWLPFVIFTTAWELLVYYPVAHWMWNDQGWLNQMGALDFAGGIVIHTTAGVSSLVAVLFLGRRHRFDDYHGEFPYSSLPTSAMGFTLLWTGWFGFNGGSALAANHSAVSAVTNSQIGAVFAACTYMVVVMIKTKKPSTIACMNGAIAGLAGITPASGYISSQAAIVLGVLLGLSVDPGMWLIKHKLRIDDALDVSVVHGLTGIIGSVFIGFCATRSVYPESEYEGVLYKGGGSLLGIQLLAVLVCGAWAAVLSALILFVTSKFMPLRVSNDHEKQGLDYAVFRERSHNNEPEDHSFVAVHASFAAHAHHSDVSMPINNYGAAIGSRDSFGPGAHQTLTRRSATHSHPPAPAVAVDADPLRPVEENETDLVLRDILAAVTNIDATETAANTNK